MTLVIGWGVKWSDDAITFAMNEAHARSLATEWNEPNDYAVAIMKCVGNSWEDSEWVEVERL